MRHKRPLRFIAARLLVLGGYCRFLSIPQKGYRLRFYPSNLSEQLWVDQACREPELRLIRAYLRPGDRVIDVGANVGDTALTASLAIGASGQVWAIEAHPRTFRFLEGNIALNGATNVESINAAAAASHGRVSFSDDRRDDMNRVGGQGIEVEARRLDDLIEWRGRIDLLKIDVEGYELPVLQGATEILRRTECILIEVAERHFQDFGYSVGALLELIEGLGMQLLQPTGPAQVQRIGSDFVTDKVENLLAVRDVVAFAQRTGWSVI